jgi:WD40 repeat protein
LVVNPQSTMMATDQSGGSIALVDLRSLALAATLPPHDGAIANALAFYPDGRTLVTGGVAGHLTLWDVPSRTARRTIRIGRPVWWVAVSPNARLLAVQTQAQGETDSRVEILRADTGQAVWGHSLPDGIGGLYFSPDGRQLAAVGCCTSRSTVATWNARSGVQLFARRSVHATAIAYQPDAHVLGVGTEDGQVLFWNSRSGRQQARPLHVASGTIVSVSFSPDGRRLAAASADLSTTLWDLRTRKQVGNTFPVQQGAVPLAEFEPNGRLLIDYLSNASEWPLDAITWERFACQVSGRDLTETEWRDLLPQRPYMHVCS